MITAPICEFVRRYRYSGALRMHMPGHKGTALLGPEPLDLTEIEGADVLYHAEGIIRESEANAAALFGTKKTVYSAEGSSLCIRAMLYLALLHARANHKKPVIAAGRNAHKVFMTAAALLDLDIRWIYGTESVISCAITPAQLEDVIVSENPAAVYITSPDYLGNVLDIAGIARECHTAGVPLAVDNAHGAYFRFLPKGGAEQRDFSAFPLHPTEAGADICCDSAHKTLPVLTGGAYLHISRNAPKGMTEKAKAAFSVFGSSSPSYLILQSLDAFNASAEKFCAELAGFLQQAAELKAKLTLHGFNVFESEPLKLTLRPKPFGYTGADLAHMLENDGVFSEFFDDDFIVFMLSPLLPAVHFKRLSNALLNIPKKPKIVSEPPKIPFPPAAVSPREALLSPSELLPAEDCLGRICSISTVGCPPAIPPVMPGEVITREVLECFKYYGVSTCRVVR
jgi:arginine decarboxylase